MKKLLTIKEAADILGVSVNTIYKWTSAKKIPYVKVGGRVMFDPDDLEAWIEARKVDPIGSSRSRNAVGVA